MRQDTRIFSRVSGRLAVRHGLKLKEAYRFIRLAESVRGSCGCKEASALLGSRKGESLSTFVNREDVIEHLGRADAANGRLLKTLFGEEWYSARYGRQPGDEIDGELMVFESQLAAERDQCSSSQ